MVYGVGTVECHMYFSMFEQIANSLYQRVKVVQILVWGEGSVEVGC
jgi:hypothetical protein